MTDCVFSTQVHHQRIIRQKRNKELHSLSLPSPYGSSLESANERHSREIWKTEEKEKLNREESDPGFVHLCIQQIFIKILRVAGVALRSGNTAPFLTELIFYEWVKRPTKQTKTPQNKTNELTRKYKYIFQTIISIMKTEQKQR